MIDTRTLPPVSPGAPAAHTQGPARAEGSTATTAAEGGSAARAHPALDAHDAGGAPLHLGDKTLARLALDLGITPESLRAGLRKLAQTVLREPSPVVNASLADAVLRGDAKDVEKYLARGGDPDQLVTIPKALLSGGAPRCEAPLISVAAGLGHADVVRLLAPLVDCDMSFAVKGLGGLKTARFGAGGGDMELNANPLVVAAFCGKPACIAALLPHVTRLDRTASAEHMQTVFHLAARTQDRSAWDALFAHPNAQAELNASPLAERQDIAAAALQWLSAGEVRQLGLLNGVRLDDSRAARFLGCVARRAVPDPDLLDLILERADLRAVELTGDGEGGASALGGALMKNEAMRARWLAHDPAAESRAGFAELTDSAVFFALRSSTTGVEPAALRELAEHIAQRSPQRSDSLGLIAGILATRGSAELLRVVEEVADKHGIELGTFPAGEYLKGVRWNHPAAARLALEYGVRRGGFAKEPDKLFAALQSQPIAAEDWCIALMETVRAKA